MKLGWVGVVQSIKREVNKNNQEKKKKRKEKKEPPEDEDEDEEGGRSGVKLSV